MMEGFDCLKRDSKIFGPHFLEASAGTGKTFSIEHIFCRLLIEAPSGSHPLTVDKILVVTFTRAAAGELKERIRKNIESALEILKGAEREEDIPSLYDYLKASFEKRELLIEYLKEALFSYDYQIFTIHGFCYSILKRFAFETRTPFEMEESSFLRLSKKIILEELRSCESEYEIKSLVSKDINMLVEKIRNFSKERSLRPYSSLLLDFQEKVKAFKGIDLESIYREFEEVRDNFKKTYFKDSLKQLSHLLKILREGECGRDQFDIILRGRLSIVKFLDPNNLKVKNCYSPSPSFSAFFNFLKEELYPIVSEATGRDNIFYRVAGEIKKRLEERLQKEDIITPDSILKRMKGSLDEGDLGDKVRKKYMAVIIDEFQDTDPVQWDIFKKLFLTNMDSLRAFYLVGDPKQSIYSFRNADIYTYLDARDHFRERRAALHKNYRSTPKLIESLNAIFSKEFSSTWIKLPKKDLALPYVPVLSAGQKMKGKPIHFFVVKDISLSQAEEGFFYPYLADEISKLESEGISFKDMAILVGDRYQAISIMRFLSGCSIPSSYRVSEMACKALYDIFLAASDPSDITKVKLAATSPYISADISSLDMDEMVSIFSTLSSTLKRDGIAPFLGKFFSTKFGDKTPIERVVGRDLSFYLSTMEITDSLFESYAGRPLSDIEEFFDNPEFFKELSPRSGEAVSIMTIHASKGLEFEVVFSMGLLKGVKASKEEEAEKLRALYVSLTRAKNRQYVPMLIGSNRRTPSSMDLFLGEGEILDKLEKFRKRSLLTYEVLKEGRAFKKRGKKEGINLSFTPYTPEKSSKYINSFSTLSREHSYRAFEEGSEILFSKKNLPPGSLSGSLVHTLFDKLLGERDFFDEGKIREVIEETLPYMDVEVEVDILKELIKRAFQTPLFKGGFSIKDVDFRNMKREEEFLYKLEDQNMMKGFIDLIFFYGGKYYIVDWKSNFLGGRESDYSEDRLKEAMRGFDYFLQASIYEECLRRYLAAYNKRPFKEIFGGVFYIFLRGLPTGGIYHFFPEKVGGKVWG